MAESEEELKTVLMKMKDESEKAGSKINIQNTKTLASSLIISQQIEREKSGICDRFYLLGFKITMDSDCSHKIKIPTPWKKSYDKPRQHIKKQRHHFANKDPSGQSYAFSSSHAWVWKLDHEKHQAG